MLLLPLLFVLFIMPSFTHQERYSCRTKAPCGCSNKLTIMTKIVGGETVTKRSWGWLVSLTHSSNHTHFCAGSILSSSWILTAAHCVSDMDASDIIINAGSNKLHQNTQQRRIANIASHPFYDPDTFVNDIALIQLSSPFDMTDSALAKICLPPQTVIPDDPPVLDDGTYANSIDYPPVGSSLVAVGWGHKVENVRLSSKELQQVTLKAVAYESETCRHLVSSPAVQFCAGVDNGGKDTCQGDSGGPLMKFSSSRRWVLAGLTSFGRGCGRAEHSGVYTRVIYYSEWINATINAEDDFDDSILTVRDTFHTDGPMDAILEELVSNVCSRHCSPVPFYITILLGLSSHFIRTSAQ